MSGRSPSAAQTRVRVDFRQVREALAAVDQAFTGAEEIADARRA